MKGSAVNAQYLPYRRITPARLVAITVIGVLAAGLIVLRVSGGATSAAAPLSAPQTIGAWTSAAHADVSGMWLLSLLALWGGTTVGGACFGMVGVAFGSVIRNSIAAIVRGLIWIHIIEVVVLQNPLPAVA